MLFVACDNDFATDVVDVVAEEGTITTLAVNVTVAQ
jgi:hypothetical protein